MPMHSLVPNLMVEDVRASCAFYEQFGFEVAVAAPADERAIHDSLSTNGPYVYAQLRNADAELMVQEAASFREDGLTEEHTEPGGTITLYAMVDDADGLYESLAEAVDVVAEPTDTWYGNREWYARDPDGYVLGIAQEDGAN